MKTTRGLSDEFMNDLIEGHLKPVLDLVKRDHTLCLQIRNERINIYYRGGNILELKKESNSYQAFFNEKYCSAGEVNIINKVTKELSKKINDEVEAIKWIQNIPFLKQIMDEYFSKYSKSEREYQQLVARENNNSIISNDTDYYITDIEYTHSESKESRFDLIGIKWESSSQKRQKADTCRIVLIEMKYGDSALVGTAGVEKHLKDIEKFCGDKRKLDILKDETILSFKQLRELGLIQFGKSGNKNQIEKLNDEKPEFILLFANHKPAKSKLKSEFEKIPNINNAEVKIATSSFMGYGLYDKNMLSVEEFMKSCLGML